MAMKPRDGHPASRLPTYPNCPIIFRLHNRAECKNTLESQQQLFSKSATVTARSTTTKDTKDNEHTSFPLAPFHAPDRSAALLSASRQVIDPEQYRVSVLQEARMIRVNKSVFICGSIL